jgi:peptide/nickel transport system substrate-binding protein
VGDVRVTGTALALLALLGTANARAQAAPTGHLRYAIARAPTSLDPANITDVEAVTVAQQIVEGLVRFKPTSTDVEPCLATAWSVSADGKSWTFTLRGGVSFHDGTPLTPAAVAFSFDRQASPASEGHYGPFIYWKTSYGYIQKVEPAGADTVVFTLAAPHAPFLNEMAMFPVAIVSPTAVRKHGREFWRHPVGTGPFRIVRWDAIKAGKGVPGEEERIVLEASPEHWAGRPKIGKVTFRAMPRATDRQDALLRGDVDVIDQVDLPFVEMARQRTEVNVHLGVGDSVAYLALNTTKPPFDNRDVRLAVHHAINKDYLVQNLYGGLAVVAKNPLPPTLWGYNDAVQAHAYSPTRARELLEKAGIKERLTTSIAVMDTPRPYLLRPRLVAERIAADLAAVGIDARVEVRPWEDHVRALRQGEHAMALMGWIGDNGDPDNFLYTLLDSDNARRGTATNFAFYDNADVHKLLMQARETMNRDARARLYRDVQVLVHEDSPLVPIAHAMQVVASSEAVRDLALHPTGVVFLAGARYYRAKSPATTRP